MRYNVAVFRSRSETLYFANMLKNYGMFVSIMNTPRACQAACGICVKFLPDNFFEVKSLLSTKPFNTFIGFYVVAFSNGRMDVERIF